MLDAQTEQGFRKAITSLRGPTTYIWEFQSGKKAKTTTDEYQITDSEEKRRVDSLARKRENIAAYELNRTTEDTPNVLCFTESDYSSTNASASPRKVSESPGVVTGSG